MTGNILWHDLYTAAVLELDRDLLPGRIEAAQTAIQRAREELTTNRGLAAWEEMQAMAEALHTLQLLQGLEFRMSTPASSQKPRLAEG